MFPKPWITNTCRIENHNFVYKRIKNRRLNDRFKIYYTVFRNSFQQDMRAAKLEFYKHTFEKCVVNLKSTWSIVNKLTI